MDSIGNKGRPGRLILLVCILITFQSILPGCSPKIIERVVERHDTTYVNRRDSLHIIDSIYVKEYVKGDTVFVEKYKDRYVYKDRWRDSISIKEVHDTTTVEKKVEKELSLIQKAKINSFWWLLVGLFASLVWIFRKPIVALIKRIIL